VSKGIINVLQLYPRDMNIYGDWGNTLVLKRRLEWHGYEVHLLAHNPGDSFPSSVDIIVGGGGQDSGQSKIGEDLIAIGPRLKALADEGVPMLMICGSSAMVPRSPACQIGI
jgi:CobQ-like glutamine amidotransferase family enzyme